MLNKEALLKIWFESDPSARSPKELYGCPPMWETLKDGDLTLFTRPCKTMDRPAAFAPYVEVDGVSYQWQRDGQWIGQGCQTTFENFEMDGPAKIDIPRPKVGFDWTKRVSFPVVTLPFIEGMPYQEKAQALSRWVKDNADRYQNKYVKMYHGTGASLPIEEEGLKPTSTTRRRSYQSASGYVYLANTPARAKMFGDLGNGGKCVVYEVVVPVRNLLADKDQLTNQRSVGKEVGDSIGDSIVYGGGVRVKGAIEPWALRRFDFERDLGATQFLVERAERERRFAALSGLRNKAGAEFTLWTVAQRAMSHIANPHGVDWQNVENTVIAESIGEHGQPPEVVEEVLARYSPGVVNVAERVTLGQRVLEWRASMNDAASMSVEDSPACGM
jgi:hypothetical protein